MTSFYEDEYDKIYNEQGDKVVDPMEGSLTDIIDRNNQQTYLAFKPTEEKLPQQPKAVK